MIDGIIRFTSENNDVFYITQYDILPFDVSGINNPKDDLILSNCSLSEKSKFGTQDTVNHFISKNGFLHFNAKNIFNEKDNTMFGLVRGGWVRPGFHKIPNPNYIFDVCSYNTLIHKLNNASDKKLFHGYFLSGDITLSFSPKFAERFIQEYMKDENTISILMSLCDERDRILKRFPSFYIDLNYTYNFLYNIMNEYKIYIYFIEDVINLYKGKTSCLKKQQKYLNDIYYLSEKHSINRFSIFYMAVIYMIIDSDTDNAHKIIMKGKNGARGKAINAFCDLLHLTMFYTLIQERPNSIFCTDDKALARLWCKLNFSEIKTISKNGEEKQKIQFHLPEGFNKFDGYERHFP